MTIMSDRSRWRQNCIYLSRQALLLNTNKVDDDQLTNDSKSNSATGVEEAISHWSGKNTNSM